MKNECIVAPAPSLYLGGEHAKHVAKHKIGAKVKLIVHGKKTSHSVYKGGKGDRHSVGIEIHKVRPFKQGKHEKNESEEYEEREEAEANE